MKPAHLVPPILALVAAGGWIGSQRRSISTLELESDALRGRLEVARQGPAATPADPSFAGRQKSKALRPGSKVDWKKIAATQAAMKSGGDGDMRAMVALQKTLLALSAEELLAGLDEIAALDLSDDAKRQLEGTLSGILANKDPEAALERYADRISGSEGGLTWQLSNAFQSWSAKDATAAAAWMDRQIEAGTFENKRLDGQHDPRIRFEAGLIQNLAASDPAEAARRLASLPEDQRDEVFTNSFHFRIRPGTEKAVAELIRTQVPEKERLSTLGRSSAPLVRQGGYGKVGEFLGAIDASAEERAAVVGEALRERFKGQDEMTTSPEETRAWILAQAPADAERLSGEALAHLSEWLDFPEMAREALKYQQASGTDDALVAFLKNAPENSRDEILELAEKISDPVKREEVMGRFINNPNRTVAPAATGP